MFPNDRELLDRWAERRPHECRKSDVFHEVWFGGKWNLLKVTNLPDLLDMRNGIVQLAVQRVLEESGRVWVLCTDPLTGVSLAQISTSPGDTKPVKATGVAPHTAILRAYLETPEKVES